MLQTKFQASKPSDSEEEDFWIFFYVFPWFEPTTPDQRPSWTLGWLVVLGLTALWDSISVYIGPSPKEREKEERNDRGEKNVQTTPHPHLLQAQ